MQQRVRNLTKRYYDELRKYYYVTPTSYLQLIKTFKSLLDKKREEVGGVINKFRRGLEQLKDAQVQVAKLEVELTELGPKLEQSEKETSELLKDLEKQQAIVAEEAKSVEKEAKECGEKTEIAQSIESECKKELEKVEPILRKATKAVTELSNSDITEIRGVQSPSTGVLLVIKTLCMLFKVNPDKKRGQTAKEGIQLDYWTPSKKKLLTPKLLKECLKFDKDNMEEEVVTSIKEITESPEYSESELKKASKAAAGLGSWVKAMVEYDRAMKIYTPKKLQLEEAKASLAEAQAAWDKAKANLAEMEAQVRKLADTFAEAEAKKKKLQRDRDDCKKKLDRAGQLIEKLAGENESWQKSLIENEAASQHLTGDILVSSGIIAYLGVFTTTYRQDCISNWIEMLSEFGIRCSEEFSLQTVLGNSLQITEWQAKLLPSDAFSVENAIILENSDRWPLMIDPQLQANIWINEMFKEEGIESIKPTTDMKRVIQKLSK